jgi:hypothetical protein
MVSVASLEHNGSVNTANGSDALELNTTGSYNTANGGSAFSNKTSNNTVTGFRAYYNKQGQHGHRFSALFSTPQAKATRPTVSVRSIATTGHDNTAMVVVRSSTTQPATKHGQRC